MFVFLHIPKTAGLSIERILRESLRPQRILRVVDTAEITYRPDEWLATRDLLTGHFGFSIFRRLPVRTTGFTMLRDPVERVRSQFRHSVDLAKGEGPGNPSRSFLRGRSLGELLEDHDDPVVDSLFRDTQTWALISDYQHHCRMPGMATERVLETARRNLSSLDGFGLVEDMETSRRCLGELLGFPLQTGTVNENASTPRPGEDDGLDDLIRRNNPLDMALYRWAREEFARRSISGWSGHGEERRDANESLSHPDRSWLEAETAREEHAAWAERAEQSLAAERHLSIERFAWAERAERSLAAERRLSAERLAWAERTEERLAAERARSAELLDRLRRAERELEDVRARVPVDGEPP